jgi:glycosyltransferase involved in cell wall biosynthesis
MASSTSAAPSSLSVFFPAYNDSGTIASQVIRALRTARRLTPDYEVIVVNDGSTDSTDQIIDALAEVYPSLRIVTHPVNCGYGAALRSGFAAASKDIIFYTDGDAQYDPGEMELLWQRMQPGVDLVNGYKISRSDPWHRIFIGRFYHHIVKTLFGLTVRDVDCDFRMMRRTIFNRVVLEKNSGVICLEMMKKIQDAGFNIVEVPVHHYHRAYGRSQFFNFPRIYRTGLDVMQLWLELVVRRNERHKAPIAAALQSGRPERAGTGPLLNKDNADPAQRGTSAL